MKRSIIVLCLSLAAAGACRAQEGVMGAPGDSVTVTVATEKTASDSVIVIRIHTADLAKQAVHEIVLKGEQPYQAPDMTLGIRFFSLYDFPGAIFFQKQIQCGAYIGIGANYKKGQYDSQGEQWSLFGSGKDTIHTIKNAWSASVSINLDVPVKRYRGWGVELALTGLYGYGKADSSMENEDNAYPYYVSRIEKNMKYSELGFGVDMHLEKEFKVGRTSFSIGLSNPLLYFSRTHEIVNTTYYYFDSRNNTYRDDNKRPWQFGYNNPLSGRIGLQLKYLFY
jgi:hypothetical protein